MSFDVVPASPLNSAFTFNGAQFPPPDSVPIFAPILAEVPNSVVKASVPPSPLLILHLPVLSFLSVVDIISSFDTSSECS